MSYETDVSVETIKAAGFDCEQLDPLVYLIKNFITQN